MIDSARMLRAELPVQRNNTLYVREFMVSPLVRRWTDTANEPNYAGDADRIATHQEVRECRLCDVFARQISQIE